MKLLIYKYSKDVKETLLYLNRSFRTKVTANMEHVFVIRFRMCNIHAKKQ